MASNSSNSNNGSPVNYRKVASTKTRGKFIAILSVNNPPVNSLGYGVRKGLKEGYQQAIADPTVTAIVIIGEGRTFPAGADIREFNDKSVRTDPLNALVNEFELSPKPIVAAIHGTALGGGLEIALSCHYRLALSSAAVGLPEVHLGILPGAGGTQRLPRLVGVEKALEMIASGAHVKAPQALAYGILDKVIEEKTSAKLLEEAISFASEIPSDLNLDTRRTKNKSAIQEGFDKETTLGMLDAARDMIARKSRGFEAPIAIVQAVRASVESPTIEAGLQVELDLMTKLMEGEQAKGLQHLFFAEREAPKIPGLPAPNKINSAVVIGAGTMGTGIAICLIEAGIDTTLIDTDPKFLTRAKDTIHKTFASNVDKGRITQEEADRKLLLLQIPTSKAQEDKLLSVADLVIEAVFESMDLKKEVFQRLNSVCQKKTILASNTSTLSIDEIAKATNRPDQVIGMHFFSPANIMRLLEVVRGKQTSPQTISTVMHLGKTIKKVSVLVGNCDGFVGNRMLEGYAKEAGFMLEEGCLPQDVDGVLTKFGMAMGPFQMGDLAGNDVSWRIRQGKGLTNPTTRKTDDRYSELADKLCEVRVFFYL
eukprot:TRINITY_DN364_c0_g4_i1.p1 TRINITY_DN364_c0_g4~~TRINITY_DN364_c0_g4_i1.p1  ORF type:complete len:617 (+),score=181.91 TRINITY_DN364_c0_g4_i1:68-1852(+)